MSKLVIGPNYIQLKPGDKIQKGDEVFIGDKWQPATNPMVYTGTWLVYRRPVKQPYYPDYRQPKAPVRPVQTLWAETPPYVAPKPDPGVGWELVPEGEEIQRGDEWYYGKNKWGQSLCVGSIVGATGIPGPYRRKNQGVPDVGAGYEILARGASIEAGDEAWCHDEWIKTSCEGAKVGDPSTVTYYRRKKQAPARPTPPEGWYYIAENETIKSGDKYLRQSNETDMVSSGVGKTVAYLQSCGAGHWCRDWVGVIRKKPKPVSVAAAWDGIAKQAKAGSCSVSNAVAGSEIKAGTFVVQSPSVFGDTLPAYEAFLQEQARRLAAEDRASALQRKIDSLETQLQFVRQDYYKTCNELGQEQKLVAEQKVEIGKLKDKLFDVEKHCRSVKSINAGLQKEIAELRDAGLPMSTAPKDQFKYIQLYMGGKWIKGTWGSHSNAWLSEGYEHSKVWDMENQPTMWKPLKA